MRVCPDCEGLELTTSTGDHMQCLNCLFEGEIRSFPEMYRIKTSCDCGFVGQEHYAPFNQLERYVKENALISQHDTNSHCRLTLSFSYPDEEATQ